MGLMSAVLVAFLVARLLSPESMAEPIEDRLALLDFVDKFPHGRTLNWSDNSSACDHWVGVKCSRDKSRIVSLRLPGVGFSGEIPPNTLSRLSALQTLSLRSNSITGPFPSDLTNIRTLTQLYLQSNNFSGPLPSNLSLWQNLTVLNLSFNAFNGTIPSSLSNLTHLVALNLSNNSFSGEIPQLDLPKLLQLNLANNSLGGRIPEPLRRFPNASFVGNNFSAPLTPVPISPRSSSPISLPSSNKRKTGNLSQSAILGIIVAVSLSIFVILALLLTVYCSKRRSGNGISGKMGKGDMSPKMVAGSQDENNRLVFFYGCRYAFDLEDLLRASAEVLGKGTFGTSYKAVLEDSTSVVVKRLKEVSAGKREFEQQMEIVGRIRHENVVQLRAYYYSKEEKLIVYDHYRQGSLSTLLHGSRDEHRVPLDWDTRLKIALGMARGAACIHMENSGKFVHGNIKASNIFLNPENYGCISDLGLTTLMNTPIPLSRAAGYRAPEVVDTRKATQASDVYSVGVVILELLTGKSPVQSIRGDEIVHLVRWVQSVVREEWTAEVFDLELMRYPNIEEELVEMLQIALSCVVRLPEQRPKMVQVVRMIEDVGKVESVRQTCCDAEADSSGGITPASQKADQ
ncbi:hypothetical protein H6P81_012855 [Aristolochia fimbriata]|uniref:Protein kinase domain-containing protein n=1 Tax=Aristolochia fimbriata TaxID=158543 RepID=A0AAV7EGM0_ARIFI|nr:hypothetical protein H6P81_012855 [Aristolochia fimbriata]